MLIYNNGHVNYYTINFLVKKKHKKKLLYYLVNYLPNNDEFVSIGLVQSKPCYALPPKMNDPIRLSCKSHCHGTRGVGGLLLRT